MTYAMMAAVVLQPSIALAPLPKDLTLGWSDEFNQGQLDATKWQAPRLERQGNQSIWDPGQVTVRDGMLRLGVRRIATEGPGPRYECGAVRTRPDYDASRTLFQKKLGYFEVRAKLPSNLRSDYWFAFWLMSGDITDNQTDSRKGAEIDVIETFQAWNNKLGHAVHWGGYGPTHNSFDIPSEPIPTLGDGKFHTYGFLWTEDVYAIYRNGKLIASTNAIGLGSKPGMPKSQGTSREPGYLKLTVEAAHWAGSSGEWETIMPERDEVLVDYIRVFDLKK